MHTFNYVENTKQKQPITWGNHSHLLYLHHQPTLPTSRRHELLSQQYWSTTSDRKTSQHTWMTNTTLFAFKATLVKSPTVHKGMSVQQLFNILQKKHVHSAKKTPLHLWSLCAWKVVIFIVSKFLVFIGKQSEPWMTVVILIPRSQSHTCIKTII